MMCSSEALIDEAHGVLLRDLSEIAGRHFQGLAQASRGFKHMSPRLRKKLHHFDITYNYTRHVTAPLLTEFVNGIRTAAQQLPREAAGGLSTSGACVSGDPEPSQDEDEISSRAVWTFRSGPFRLILATRPLPEDSHDRCCALGGGCTRALPRLALR